MFGTSMFREVNEPADRSRADTIAITCRSAGEG